MKKIAIPVTNDMLDPHFGHCSRFYIYEIDEGKIVNEEHLEPPMHEPGLLPKWLGKLEVTDIIAGGIGSRAINLFNQNRINVFAGAPKKPAGEIVKDFLEGSLELTGNYCDH